MYIITQVRVRHMVVKPIEDRYPKWDDNEVSIELDNMIQDILKGQLDEKFWEVTAATKSNKRKIHVHPPVVPDTTDVGPSSKRKKDNEHGDGCQASEMVCRYKGSIKYLNTYLNMLFLTLPELFFWFVNCL